MHRKTDILIIGGGAVGICSAYYLSKLGKAVTLIEKDDICAGNSYGNAGLIVPSHSVPLAAPGVIAKGIRWMLDAESPFYIKPRFSLELIDWLLKFRRACNARRMHRAIPVLRSLNLLSLELFDQLSKSESLDFGLQKRGMLTLFITPKEFEAGAAEADLLKEYGVETRILMPDELDDFLSGVKTAAIGGVFYPQDAHLIPNRFVEALATTIIAQGVTIETAAEVIGFETIGTRIRTVRTTRGDFSADRIVLAGGAWSSGILKSLKLSLPIQPAKGYSLTYTRPVNCPDMPLALAEAKVILTPMADTVRFAGTLELAGMDFSINMRRVQAIVKRIPAFLPGIDPQRLELIEIWRGLRPCTPDGLPIIGPSRIYENLIIATGHGMLGISLSAVTGKLVSRIAAGEYPEIDITALRPVRF